MKQRKQSGWLTVKAGKYYGHYYVYEVHQGQKDKRRHRCVVLGSRTDLSREAARELLSSSIQRELGIVATPQRPRKVTVGWFVENCYLPGKSIEWEPVTRRAESNFVRHYIVEQWGDQQLSEVTYVALRDHLNNLEKQGYGQWTLRNYARHLRRIFERARATKYIRENPTVYLRVPKTNRRRERSRITEEQLCRLIDAVTDLRDKCLLCVGALCMLRAGEVLGLTWGAFRDDYLFINSTASRGKLSDDTKTPASRACVPIPFPIRGVIAAWRLVCNDTSPNALMFPTYSRGKGGRPVPFVADNFYRYRLQPIAAALGIPRELLNFRVMRRSGATLMQKFGSVKDIQAMLRQVNPRTTLDHYVDPLPDAVREALDRRTSALLGDENGFGPAIG